MFPRHCLFSPHSAGDQLKAHLYFNGGPEEHGTSDPDEYETSDPDGLDTSETMTDEELEAMEEAERVEGLQDTYRSGLEAIEAAGDDPEALAAALNNQKDAAAAVVAEDAETGIRQARGSLEGRLTSMGIQGEDANAILAEFDSQFVNVDYEWAGFREGGLKEVKTNKKMEDLNEANEAQAESIAEAMKADALETETGEHTDKLAWIDTNIEASNSSVSALQRSAGRLKTELETDQANMKEDTQTLTFMSETYGLPTDLNVLLSMGDDELESGIASHIEGEMSEVALIDAGGPDRIIANRLAQAKQNISRYKFAQESLQAISESLRDVQERLASSKEFNKDLKEDRKVAVENFNAVQQSIIEGSYEVDGVSINEAALAEADEVMSPEEQTIHEQYMQEAINAADALAQKAAVGKLEAAYDELKGSRDQKQERYDTRLSNLERQSGEAYTELLRYGRLVGVNERTLAQGSDAVKSAIENNIIENTSEVALVDARLTPDESTEDTIARMTENRHSEFSRKQATHQRLAARASSDPVTGRIGDNVLNAYQSTIDDYDAEMARMQSTIDQLSTSA